MSEEELQKKMEFIVNQQAQFTVDIQRLREEQSELTKKQQHLTDALTTVVGIVGKVATAQEQLATEQKQQRAEFSEQMKRLAAAQAETDERLNIFVNVVERYISERRNGKGEGDKPPAVGA